MNQIKITTLLIGSLLLALNLPISVAAESAIEAALNSDIRSAEDKARDASRKPAETLGFFGVTPQSKVLELVPGGGWYTKILGSYLKPKGELYLAIGANPERLALAENNLGHVKIIGKDFKLTPTEQRGIRNAQGETFGADDFDFVLTFRNMHNLSPDARAIVNKVVFDALQPGGIYGVIDHTRRHMEPSSEQLWRRLDPVQIIKEIESAGFIFDDYSDLHARPADKLIHDSTHPSIGRDSDRFTLKFRKPN